MPLPTLAPLASCLLVLAIVEPSADAVTAAGGRDVATHVQDVASLVTPHLPRLGQAPPVAVVERAAVTAGLVDGELQVSTGLLGALSSDAELALLLAYETARALPPPRSSSSRGPGTGERVARAITIAAVTGLAVGATSDALDGSSCAVRGAGTAVAGTGAAIGVSVALDRRHGRSQASMDDAAAADAMRAVIAAGYDGHAALGLWDALTRATPLGGSDGGQGDHDANRHRAAACRRVLSSADQKATARSGHLVGDQAYRREVLDRLDAWRFAVPSPPEPTAPDAPGSPPGAETDGAWLAWSRSGGITGWVERVRVWPDGRVEVRQSPDRGADGRRLTLAADELARLRESVGAVLAAPAREGTAELRWMRDAQVRTLAVDVGGAPAHVQLSDGYRLLPEDWALVRQLDDLARRAGAGEGGQPTPAR